MEREKGGAGANAASDGKTLETRHVDTHERSRNRKKGLRRLHPRTGMKASRRWMRDRAKLGRGVLAQDGGALLLARATDTPSSSRGWMEARVGPRHDPGDRCNLLCRLFHLYDKTPP